jgi:transcriptional regulator NrdR family protein
MSAVPNFHTKFSVRELDSQHVGFINLGKINEIENETSVWYASIELHEFKHYESFSDYVCSVEYYTDT